jgi:hypothetical protein
MWTFQVGTLHLLSRPLGLSSISTGLQPSTLPTVSVLITDPPLAGEAYVTYMHGDHLRPLIRGIRLTFPPPASLIALGFLAHLGDNALRSAIKGLFINDSETPLSL